MFGKKLICSLHFSSALPVPLALNFRGIFVFPLYFWSYFCFLSFIYFALFHLLPCNVLFLSFISSSLLFGLFSFLTFILVLFSFTLLLHNLSCHCSTCDPFFCNVFFKNILKLSILDHYICYNLVCILQGSEAYTVCKINSKYLLVL